MKSFLPVPDPIAFTVFGVEIRWYAICIVVGMIVGVTIMYRRAASYRIEPADRVLDYILWIIPLSVIGARVYYVIFEWENYAGDIMKMLDIRGGGLAIHGGLIFGIITAFILTRVWKHNAFEWLDLTAPSIAIGQAFGRWGNYFNSEAHGTPTTLPWAIECQGELVHPTFLYESIWCLLLCIFLIRFDRKGKKKFSGQIMLMYLVLYSFERFFVEGLRTDSLMIGNIRQAQLLSAVVLFAGLTVLAAMLSKAKKLGDPGHARIEQKGIFNMESIPAEAPPAAEKAEESEEGPKAEDADPS